MEVSRLTLPSVQSLEELVSVKISLHRQRKLDSVLIVKEMFFLLIALRLISLYKSFFFFKDRLQQQCDCWKTLINQIPTGANKQCSEVEYLSSVNANYSQNVLAFLVLTEHTHYFSDNSCSIDCTMFLAHCFF